MIQFFEFIFFFIFLFNFFIDFYLVIVYNRATLGGVYFMPRFTVTKELGLALKNLRSQKNVKAIDIAKSIHKTSAYISKLEKGILNTIEENDLLNIIYYLSKDSDEFNENIQNLLSDTNVSLTEKESASEEWKLNLDLFYRHISVPQSYKDIVKEKLTTLNISISELAEYINKNYDLYSNKSLSHELLDKAQKNHWYFNNGNSFVVVHVEEEDLQNIIYSGEKTVSNYSILLYIIFSLFRLEKIPHDESYRKAKNLLNDLQIHTLREKNLIMQAFDAQKHTNNLLEQRKNDSLPLEDRELLTLFYKIINKLHAFAELEGIDYTNKKLSTLLSNLSADPITFMGYIGIDLSQLKDCDFEIKKEFVSAVNDLVKEYSTKEPTPKKELI